MLKESIIEYCKSLPNIYDATFSEFYHFLTVVTRKENYYFTVAIRGISTYKLAQHLDFDFDISDPNFLLKLKDLVSYA